MVKIIEIKETIYDSQLIDNIYAIDKTVKEIMNETNFITELNRDDYNYINIILEPFFKSVSLTVLFTS